MSQSNVLIIDDDFDYAECIAEALSDEFSTTICTDGNEAISKYAEERPDIVLLDIQFPDVSGFDICQKIKSQDDKNDTSVIFISGTESLQDKIKSYEFGGDDFISKPFNLKELITKVNNIEAFQQKTKSLKENEELARSTAFASMQEASQYGQILQFMRKSFNCESVDELVNLTFEALESFGLSCCLQIRTKSGEINFRPNGQPCSPIEINLFNQLQRQEKIFEFGTRLMLTNSNVSLLVKNMPLDNIDLCGRLRDVLCIVLDGVEAAIMQITKSNALLTLLSDIKDMISLIETKFESHENQTVHIMDSLLVNMQSGMHFLDLTEEQEAYYIDLVNKSMASLIQLYSEGRDIDEVFSAIVTKLEKEIGQA